MQAAAGSSGPAHTASKLRQLSARPKRSLGQNFCTSDAVLEARMLSICQRWGPLVLSTGVTL